MKVKHINVVERLYCRHITKENGVKLAGIALAGVVVAFILLTK